MDFESVQSPGIYRLRRDRARDLEKSGQRGSGSPLGWLRYLAKGMRPFEAVSRHISTSPQGFVTGSIERHGCAPARNASRAARALFRAGGMGG
jgi:hypothetical protein